MRIINDLFVYYVDMFIDLVLIDIHLVSSLF